MSLLGKSAPDFKTKNHLMEDVTLSQFKGKKVLIAFYPAAFTGVCQKEMCTFQDGLEAMNGLGAEVLGVSTDMPFSNKVFAEQNGIQFSLLSDPSRSIVKAYGTTFENFAGMDGCTVAQRSVFIVDEHGVVSFEWIAENPGVEPDYDAVKAALA